MLNTRGLKMRGIKAASAATNGLSPYGWGRVQISYDRDDGEILTDYHIGNDWTQYRSVSIITAGWANRPMSMQEIADVIADAVSYYQAVESNR